MKKIKLTQGKFALVDDQDYEFLMQWKWYAEKYYNKLFYAHRHSNKINYIIIQMHRVIAERMNLDVESKKVDHVDRNGLNNQRNNLRISTNSQSQMNQGIRKDNTSGYKGVSWNRRLKKWHSQICYRHKRIHLGYFDDKEDAARAYNEAAIKYHKEFAVLNNV